MLTVLMSSLIKILIVVSLVANFSGISAQTIQTIQTYNIDSLKQVLSTDLHDTNRIWALNNLGRNIQNSDTILVLAEAGHCFVATHRIYARRSGGL